MSLALSPAGLESGEPGNHSPYSSVLTFEYSFAGPQLLASFDTRIGNDSTSYLDPEFLPEQGLVTWQDRDADIWLCELHQRTGELIPPDGKGTLIGRGAPMVDKDDDWPTDLSYNGPEFGISREGIKIYYSSVDDLSYQVAQYDLATQRSTLLAPGRTKWCRAIYPSSDRTDEVGRVLYGGFETTPAGLIKNLFNEWMDDAAPHMAHAFPVVTWGSNGVRWLPGQRAILTNWRDANGTVQIARYDVDSARTTILTRGPEPKIDAVPFRVPEFDNDLMFVAIANLAWLDVYRHRGGFWNRIQRLSAPRSRTQGVHAETVSSPELVSYRGTSYVTYIAKYSDDTRRVCLSSLDGRLSAAISPEGGFRPIDPEGLVIGNRLQVYYYTAPNSSGINELHRCNVLLWP